MVVGCDIDGVLINSSDMWLEAGMRYAKVNHIDVQVNKDAFLTSEIFSWDKKTDDDFWKEFYEDYYKFSLPTNESINALRKLKSMGHEIVLVTSRGILGFEKEYIGIDNLIEITKEWLRKNDVPFDKILFAPNGSKTKMCLENNIDVFIDDYSKNVLDLSTVMPVITFARPYNEDIKNIEGTNYKVFRTSDWNLVVTIIEYRLQKYL